MLQTFLSQILLLIPNWYRDESGWFAWDWMPDLRRNECTIRHRSTETPPA